MIGMKLRYNVTGTVIEIEDGADASHYLASGFTPVDVVEVVPETVDAEDAVAVPEPEPVAPTKVRATRKN